jgi:hypothetical protein
MAAGGSERPGGWRGFSANPRIEIERGGDPRHHATWFPRRPAGSTRRWRKCSFADRMLGYLMPSSRGRSMAVRLDPDS